MEASGAASSIVALIELTVEVLGYMNDVHDAGKDREAYYREAPLLCGLLTTLRVHIAGGGGQGGSSWYKSVRQLEHGPMQQYQAALEVFAAKVAPGTGH